MEHTLLHVMPVMHFLYSNKLGEKMYTITAPIMGLPCACQAKRIRSKERDSTHYLPGLNEGAFEKIKV